MAKIGGVQVSDGGTIYWGTFLSVLLGAPVGAYYLGVQRTIASIRDGILRGMEGVESTALGFVSAVFAGFASPLATAQESFVSSVAKLPETSVTVPAGLVRAIPGTGPTSTSSSVQLSLGPFTFAIGVLVALASVWVFLRGLQLAKGGLRG
jgi:hypothetical protein